MINTKLTPNHNLFCYMWPIGTQSDRNFPRFIIAPFIHWRIWAQWILFVPWERIS